MDKLKILLVDDDINILTLYDNAFTGDMFEKSIAMNGEEALELYQSWKPDIILLDIMIPKLSGCEVLKEIRHTFSDDTTTIVMATGYTEKEVIQDCMKWNINGYIVKPFKYKEIAPRILQFHRLAR